MQGKHNWRSAAAAVAVLSALGLALAVGFLQDSAPAPDRGQIAVPDEDSLAVSSSGRVMRRQSEGQASAGSGAAMLEQQKKADEQKAQVLAAQQAAAQQAALAQQQQQLQLQAAEQAARERHLEQERQSLAAEKQQADAAAAAAEKLRASTAAAEAAERLKQQAQSRPRQAYSGPSSGAIVWQGIVQGTTLVTIEDNTSDTGQVISGGLPGVLVMVQPADTRHVGVAGAPAPSNSYRRLTLRVQGKGVMQEIIHWSIP